MKARDVLFRVLVRIHSIKWHSLHLWPVDFEVFPDRPVKTTEGLILILFLRNSRSSLSSFIRELQEKKQPTAKFDQFVEG